MECFSWTLNNGYGYPTQQVQIGGFESCRPCFAWVYVNVVYSVYQYQFSGSYHLRCKNLKHLVILNKNVYFRLVKLPFVT